MKSYELVPQTKPSPDCESFSTTVWQRQNINRAIWCVAVWLIELQYGPLGKKQNTSATPALNIYQSTKWISLVINLWMDVRFALRCYIFNRHQKWNKKEKPVELQAHWRQISNGHKLGLSVIISHVLMKNILMNKLGFTNVLLGFFYNLIWSKQRNREYLQTSVLLLRNIFIACHNDCPAFFYL